MRGTLWGHQGGSLKPWLMVLGLATVSLAGCGRSDLPELGYVSGTVKSADKPLVGLIVVFKPDEGRAATGQTDENGYYELKYLHNEEGCKTGPNTVSFEWELGASGPGIPSEYAPGRSTLKRDVKAGDNVFDFTIETSGGAGSGPVN